MRVILFEDGTKGFGIAEVKAPSESNAPVYPANGYYHRALNMDCRFGGAVPAWYIGIGGDLLYKDPLYCFSWRDNNDEPLVVLAAGTKTARWQNGGFASETAFAAAATGATIWEDGSGNSVLIVGFDAAAVVKKRTTTADGWSAAGDAKVGKIAAVGPDLYAQTDAGVFSGYKAAKCVAGNDPTDASNWSAGEPVGHPAWAVNSIVDGGGYPVVGKPDGAFYWSNVFSAYVPILSFLANAPHPDNCKGMTPVSGGVLIPLADGSLWLWNGAAATRVSGNFSPNQDTAGSVGRVTAIVDTGATIYAAVETYARHTQNIITSVKKEDGGVFTSATGVSSVTVDDRSKTFDVASLGDTTTDYLYVGSSLPLFGVHALVGTANTGSEAFDKVEYHDGTTWQDGVLVDGTTTDGTKGLEQDGYLGMAPTGDSRAQGKGTVDSVEAYWLRFKVTATGFSAGTTISEIRAIPARPKVGGLVDHGDFDLAAAGVVHILAGVRTAEGITWHDNLAALARGSLTAGCVTDTRPGSAFNTGNMLLFASGQRLIEISLGKDDNPLTTVCPALTDATSLSYAESVLYPCRVRFPERMRAKSFHLDVEHFDNADTLELFMRWDQGPFFAAGTLKNAPGTVDLEGRENSGLCLEVAVAYDDAASTELFAPRIRRIEVEVEPTGERFDAVPYLQEQVPTVE